MPSFSVIYGLLH